MPAGMVDDAADVTVPGIRPAFLSSAWAWDSGTPVTCGTPTMTGPMDSRRVTVLPFLALEPIAGSVATTSPFGRLLCRPGPTCTVKPRFCSSAWAVAAAIPCTAGTLEYCPAVTHQVITPMTTTTPTVRAR